MAFLSGEMSGRSLTDLSDEEVLSLARSGDRLAVEHLLSRYRSFVESRARSYYLSGADRDDVIQEGMIGLYKAIRDYNSERSVPFRAFAEVCVTRQIISAVKSASRRKHLPLNQYVSFFRGMDEDGAHPLDSLIDPSGNEPEATVLTRRLSDYLETVGKHELSDLENQVVRRRLEGKTYEQMALELHCPPKCVDNALQRAKRKIWSRISVSD
jgi:RNA polymerase sporulation-specific sigma factor